MAKREVRTVSELKIEVRADGAAGDEMALQGYAALFNMQSRDLGGFRETIAPGAFTRSLKDKADVRCLFNHDPNRILGRTKSGTLSVEQDERGLKFRAVLDPTSQIHRDIYASVKRGDIDECSFAFTVAKDGQSWAERTEGDQTYYARTLTDVDLSDVSAVCYPAYYGTNVDARCLFPDGEVSEIRSAIESLTAQRTKAAAEKRAAEEQSFEDVQKAINVALCAKYPSEPNCPCNYWTIETYDTYTIACDWASGKYWKISYHIGDDGVALLGDDVQEMEQTWVPASERGIKAAAEYRSAKEKAAVDAPATRSHSQEHKEPATGGDCMDPECACQNRSTMCDDVFDDDGDGDNDSEDERKIRKAARFAEQRAAGEKVLTKLVDGKELHAGQFAYVGDAKKTETWKLPIMDAAHVRNALARFNQTEGIPAGEKAGVLHKIKAAAAKFGVDVADDAARCLAALPLTEDDIRAIRVRLQKAML